MTLRDTILDAVDRLLGRHGYRKMTLDDIAREAGIGRRTIYLHFSSKEELAFSSIDRVVDRLLAELRLLASGDQPAPERIRRMLITRVLFRFDSVHDYHQGLDDMFAVLRPKYLERRHAYFASEARVFAAVIRGGQQANALRDGPPLEIAHTLLLATNSLLPSNLSARELGERRQVEAKVTRLACLLLDGLRSRRRAGGLDLPPTVPASRRRRGRRSAGQHRRLSTR